MQVLDGPVLVVRLDALHVGEGVQAADQLAEDGVLAVEVLARAVGDETENDSSVRTISFQLELRNSQLRLVRVWPRICHAQYSAACVREVLLNFVLERGAPK